MAAFEKRHNHEQEAIEHVLGVNRNDRNDCDDKLDPRRLREECIIAQKVYDSCRQQDCLTPDELGPARAAECVCVCGEDINEGDVIVPPSNAAAVTIDKMKVKKIIIVEKNRNEFKNGFWDIDIKYVFEYRLTFREADGSVIGSILANSIFNKKVTLFGSIGADLTISTDFYKNWCENTTIDAEPFILVEAKAIALAAEIKCRRFGRDESEEDEITTSRRNPRCVVNVTIGLFTIIKLFRLVNLTVESRGFCIPEECEEISPIDACEFFENLDFPLDIFDPPQRPEFVAGISGNIHRDRDPDCGCGNKR
jgi:hypothetical protein